MCDRSKGTRCVFDQYGRFLPAVEVNRVRDAGVRSRGRWNLTHSINLSRCHCACRRGSTWLPVAEIAGREDPNAESLDVVRQATQLLVVFVCA